MRIITRFVMLLSLIGLLFACSSSENVDSSPIRTEWVRHTGWSAQTRSVKWSGTRDPTSLFVGFVRPEDRDVPPEQRTSPITKFRVQQDSSFKTLLILKSGYDKPYPVLVSVFLDYNQVGFRLDAQSGLLHYLAIEPGVDMEIPLEVGIDTPGWHDLFVVVFRAPDDHPADSGERLPSRFGIGGIRTVICSGECTEPAHELPEALVGQGSDVRNFNAYALPLLPNDGTPPKQRLLTSTRAKPGMTFNMELWARNPNENPRNYVVIPLFDFTQVSFAGSKVLHLRMPPGSELLISGSIPIPNDMGVHELEFIYVFDPYQDIESTSDPFVKSFLRSALVVGDGQ